MSFFVCFGMGGFYYCVDRQPACFLFGFREQLQSMATLYRAATILNTPSPVNFVIIKSIICIFSIMMTRDALILQEWYFIGKSPLKK